MDDLRRKIVEFPIIDSHIHLYATDHIKDLAWTSDLPSNHVLNRQNSIAEYQVASKSQPRLQGFIFVETDRKSCLSENGWQYALEEVDFLRRIKAGTPRANEGHNPDDRSLLLGAVPWAPLPADPVLFNKYLDQVAQITGDLSTNSSTPLIKGFRYLFQDKPPGTQLNPNIITNLLTLESRGYKTFDLGVDFHSHGVSQLLESIDMLSRIDGRTSGTLKIVLNHLCKPDLTAPTFDVSSSNDGLVHWTMCIRRLAAFGFMYMKLSGLFSELTPDVSTTSTPRTTADILEIVRPYTRLMFECFGARRIMFGSDWPVCVAGAEGAGLEVDGAWERWVDVVSAVLEDVGCDEEEKRMVWGGTAREVYGIE